MDSLWNGVIADEERPGWRTACEACGQTVAFTVLNLGPGVEPFLYCDRCPNLVLRPEDADLAAALGGDHAPSPEQMKQLYEDLERRLPPCPCGGRFSLQAQPHCPHCGQALSADARVNDLSLIATQAAWIQGGIAFRGAIMPSNRLVRVRVSAASAAVPPNGQRTTSGGR
jgi:hypothetical protein